MKRLYHILSLLAITHLFALAGLLVFLFATGRLDEERLEQIASVLRGEYPDAAPAAPSDPAPEAEPIASAEEIARAASEREFYELLSARQATEHRDRLGLHEEIWLRTVRLQEDLERQRRLFEEQKRAFFEETQQQGFETVLEMLASIDPAQAKELLRRSGDFKEADVVRLLMAMDPNRSKRIVNECQTEEELRWIGRILNQIHEINQASANGVDGP